MSATTETYELHHAETNEKLETREVHAEVARQDGQVATPAELAAMERQLKAGISDFRAELDAIRKSGLLGVHMPDGKEARRRRELLAPLAQPGWVPEAPQHITAEQYMAARDLREPSWRERRRSRKFTRSVNRKLRAIAPAEPRTRWRRFASAVGDALAWAGRA